MEGQLRGRLPLVARSKQGAVHKSGFFRGPIVTTTSARLLLWGPRVLGILVCVFLSLFALDAFNEGKTFSEALPAFAIHIAPALVLLAIVAASWRWEWLGGVVFVALAVAYMTIARNHLDWILVISGPLLAVGTLFLWSWRFHEELHAPRARKLS